jgi:uncharacterized protein (TIGR03437 family)
MHKKVFTRLLLALGLALAALTPVLAQTSVAIVNGASFKAGFPVSPGSWASAFGDFASVGITTETQNGVLPVPTTLGGVQVLVNNVAAALNYVGPGQINFIVPAGTAEGKQPLKITVSGLTTFDGFVQVWPVSPGIFIKDFADVLQPGAVLNQDFSENGPNNPAQRGEVVQIYGTGGDFVNFPNPNGAAAPPAPNLVLTGTTPKAYVSVAEAAVQFSGLAPGFAALWQVNVTVPNQPFISGQVPLFIEAATLGSNVVSIWVAE